MTAGTDTPVQVTDRYWCEYAWLPPGEIRTRVRIDLDGDRFLEVEPDTDPPEQATRLPGLTLPGMANTHSHAFHRALRGRSQGRSAGTSFWGWREQMYALAERLDPADYRELAMQTFSEMVAAGITCVGEFHYLHHRSGGESYADPNAMGHALVDAARAAGLRITLLDTCYLTGDIGRALVDTQQRFGDGDAHRWAERVDALREAYDSAPDVVVGGAIHSVRAVPADELGVVAEWAALHHAPLHVHLSEQPRENLDCLGRYGRTPTRLLYDRGVLGPRTTAVHATHLEDADVALLGETETTIALCPTTERDLGDGLGRAGDLVRAGAVLTVGTDSHAVIDPFEELRGVEYGERLRTLARRHWTSAELLRMGTEHGHAALGFPDGGVIAPGAWADLVTVRLDSPRTRPAGPSPARSSDDLADAVVFAATAADVTHVVASGRRRPVGG